MNNSSSSEFLGRELDSSIEILKTKAAKQKSKTKVFQGLSIVLGALITLILGLDVPDTHATFQKNTALIFGAALTVINGWLALFNYRKLWIRQKSTLLALYQLRNELNFRISNNTESAVDDLFETYLSIWESDSAEWSQIVRKDGKSKAEKKDDTK